MKQFNFNKKFKSFFEAILNNRNKRIILISGGRGSGKTTALNTAVVLRILQNNDEKIIYSRYLSKSLYHSASDIDKIIDGLGVKNTIQIKKNFNEYNIKYKKTEVLFIGLFNSIKNESIKSISNVSTLVIEEANAVKNDTDILIPHNTVRHPTINNVTVLCFNPKDKNDVIYKLFYEPCLFKGNIEIEKITYKDTVFEVPIVVGDDILHIHTTFLDNPNLPNDFIKEGERVFLTDLDVFKRDFIGIYSNVASFVIKSLSYIQEDIDTFDKPYYFGLDLGYNDATALQITYKINKNTLYTKNLLYDRFLTAQQVYDKVTEIVKQYDTRVVYCDTNNKNITELLKTAGLTIRYKNTKKTITEQYGFINNYNIITDDMSTYNDLRSLVWTKDGKEAINKEGNHIADAFRYSCIGLLSNNTILAVI